MKMLKAVIISVGILSVTSCATLGPRRDTAIQKIKVIDSVEVTRFTFKNGLRLVVHQDRSSPTFAYQVWFDVGSRNEERGKTGLAHLFEHMMFKGTKSVADGEFDRILDEAGAEGQNAYTTKDHTTYIEQLPKERLELIIKLEADRMRNLIVNDQSFSTEREVVQNERRFRYENDPGGLMYQELYGLAFTKHPYRWPVIGYAEDLARMTAEDARSFYQKHYAPNRAVIVVSGDVDAFRVRDLVEKYYGSYQQVESSPAPLEMEPEQKSPRRKTLRFDIQVEKLMMAYPIPNREHEDQAALDVIQTVLSSGRSSRLQKALVDSGIATGAGAYGSDAKDPDLFIFNVSLQDKVKANLAEKVLLRELARLSTEEVSPMELERAKNILNFGFFSSLESNSEKADFIGLYESQMGGAERGLEKHKKRLQVTPTQIREVANRYFNPERRSVVVGLKKSTN